MRTLALLLALAGSLTAVAGCDAFSEALTDDAPAVMASLDGTWSRTITAERIAADGDVTPDGNPRVDTYEVARSVQCNSISLTNVADSDRVTVATDPAFPGGSRTCGVLTADHDGLRIIRVGDGPGSTDVAGTIRERSGARHVWEFYTPLTDGAARREVWTLTPR